MTDAARKDWDAKVKTRTTDKSIASISTFMYFDGNAGAIKVRSDLDRPAVNIKIGKATAEIGTGDQLVLKYNVDSEFRYLDTKTDTPTRIVAHKTVTVYLVKGTTPERPFLIDGWKGSFHPSQSLPDTK